MQPSEEDTGVLSAAVGRLSIVDCFARVGRTAETDLLEQGRNGWRIAGRGKAAVKVAGRIAVLAAPE